MYKLLCLISKREFLKTTFSDWLDSILLDYSWRLCLMITLWHLGSAGQATPAAPLPQVCTAVLRSSAERGLGPTEMLPMKGRSLQTHPTWYTIPGRIPHGNTHADTPKAPVHWGHRPDWGKRAIRGLRPALVTLQVFRPTQGTGHIRGVSSHRVVARQHPVARAYSPPWWWRQHSPLKHW